VGVIERTDTSDYDRVRVAGKFLEVAGSPFAVRGVTYGGFKARVDGWQFPDSALLKADMAVISPIASRPQH
jgi:hypothetical protein